MQQQPQQQLGSGHQKSSDAINRESLVQQQQQQLMMVGNPANLHQMLGHKTFGIPTTFSTPTSSTKVGRVEVLGKHAASTEMIDGIKVN